MTTKIPSKDAVEMAIAATASESIPNDRQLLGWLSSRPLETGLDHWQLWTLICLHRHLNRQKWVGYVVETRLKGELTKLGTSGALGHPEGVPQEGEVPDEPGWRYFFHGRGCCLTHAESGASIDVDFTDDGTTERIDRYFYSNFLEDLKFPEFPEQLLQKKSPLEHSWQANIDPLVEAGCLETSEGIRLTQLGREIAEVLDPLIERMGEIAGADSISKQLNLFSVALMLGDAVLGRRIAKLAKIQNSLSVKVIEAAEKCEQAFADRLVERLKALSPDSSTLAALAALDLPCAKLVVKESLFRTPVDGIANTALAAYAEWDLPDLVPTLEELIEHRHGQAFGNGLLSRFLPKSKSSSDAMPRQTQVVRAIIALLAHLPVGSVQENLKKRILELLNITNGAHAGEAALLLYSFDIELGLERLKLALSGTVPAAHKDAAAACILIGTQQAQSILIAGLDNPAVQIQHTVACALKRFPTQTAREAASRWFVRSDGIDAPLGKDLSIDGRTIATYSFEDVSHANMDLFVSSALERLRRDFGQILACK